MGQGLCFSSLPHITALEMDGPWLFKGSFWCHGCLELPLNFQSDLAHPLHMAEHTCLMLIVLACVSHILKENQEIKISEFWVICIALESNHILAQY